MKEMKDISSFYDFTIAQELRIESLVKDISIGFGKWITDYGCAPIGYDLFICVDETGRYKKNTEQLFNEYLNTLK